MARRLAAVVAFVVLAASCGIPVDSTPRSAGAPDNQAPTPTSAGGAGTTNAYVYLVLDQRLVATPREVSARTPSAVLSALFQAPSEDDVAHGLVSAIPPETEILDVRQRGTVLNVELSDQFEEVIGVTRQQAVGQIVMTATELPGVVELTVSIDGTLTPVPTPGGSDKARVQDCDYLPLLATSDALDAADIIGEPAGRMAIRRLSMERRCPEVDPSSP